MQNPLLSDDIEQLLRIETEARTWTTNKGLIGLRAQMTRGLKL